MKINWFGTCSFLIQDSLGRRIILDPIDLTHTKEIIKLNPQIIMITHEYDTNISTYLSSNKQIYFNKLSTYSTEFFSMSTFNSYHDNYHGLKRGKNIIYNFTFDNITFCTLGHLGHGLDNNIFKKLKNVDILFIPIGGHLTIDGYEAAKIVKKINPKIVIPMYYKYKDSLIYLDDIKNFLFSIKNTQVENLKTFDFKELNNNKTRIILLTPHL